MTMPSRMPEARCRNCGFVVMPLCPDDWVCFKCHDLTIQDTLDELGIQTVKAGHFQERLQRYIEEADQQQAQGQSIRVRTLGERMIGSQWYPASAEDALRDDIHATVKSIERFIANNTSTGG